MRTSSLTVFQYRDSGDGAAPGSSFGLAPELAKKARSRVKWFAFAMLMMSLLGIGLNVFFGALGSIEQPTYSMEVLILCANSVMAATT